MDDAEIGGERLAAWRILLKKLIALPAEKQRAADQLGVQKWTLTRWANGEVRPRDGYLQLLPEVFPQHQAELERLISQEFPSITFTKKIASSPPNKETPLKEIPSVFYARLLKAKAHDRYFSSLSTWQLGMLQISGQIDPERRGIHIRIFGLSSSHHSLYELVAAKNHQLQLNNLWLIGRESLIGQTVLSGNSLSFGEQEIIALIKSEQKIAGCLHVSCPYPEQVTSVRAELASLYADLFAATSFAPSSFVEQQELQRQLAEVIQPQAQQNFLLHSQRFAVNKDKTPTTIASMESVLLINERNSPI